MQRRAALQVQTDAAGLAAIRDAVEAWARALGLAELAVYDLVLATHELAANVARHGYRGQPGPIAIELRQIGDAVEIRIRDSAPRFDPASAPAPDISVRPERRPPGGLGIHMVRSMTDTLRHRALDGGNEVTIIKRGVLPAHAAE